MSVQFGYLSGEIWHNFICLWSNKVLWHYYRDGFEKRRIYFWRFWGKSGLWLNALTQSGFEVSMLFHGGANKKVKFALIFRGVRRSWPKPVKFTLVFRLLQKWRKATLRVTLYHKKQKLDLRTNLNHDSRLVFFCALYQSWTIIWFSLISSTVF